MTDENTKFDEVAKDTSEEPDMMMKKIDKELNRIKYISFGKVKIRQKPKGNKELENLQLQKVKCFEDYMNDTTDMDEKVKVIDNNIAKNLLQQQRKNVEKELISMKEIQKNKGRSALVFKLKEKVVGAKKVSQEATVIIDPKSKKEVNTPVEIKRVSIEYCQNLLTNREPKPEFTDDLEMKYIIHRMRMMEEVKDDIQFSQELFNKSLNILKKKAGGKYDSLTKCGQSLKAALYNLFKVI